MTTKKIVIIIASVLAGLILIAVLFVGAILGFVFYTLGHSQAAITAKSFLQRNDKLKGDIGEVKDFGSIVTGSINTRDRDGSATLRLKVIGTRRTVNASVDLVYRGSSAWRVTDASYVDEAGETIALLDKYESSPPE